MSGTSVGPSRKGSAVLLGRHQHAQTAAVELHLHALDLLAQNQALREEARQLRERSAENRRQSAAARLRRRNDSYWFSVRGIVENTPTTAHWAPDSLDCDAELLRRAQVVVAFGETFITEAAPGHVVHASLDSPPIAVLLTIMRAFTVVTAVDISLDMFQAS